MCSRECVWLINMCILIYLRNLLLQFYDECPRAQAGVFQGTRNIKPWRWSQGSPRNVGILFRIDGAIGPTVRNMLTFFQWRVVSLAPNPDQGPPLVGYPRLLTQYIILLTKHYLGVQAKEDETGVGENKCTGTSGRGNKVPYFSIDNAHPKLFRRSFWCVDNAHDVFFDR